MNRRVGVCAAVALASTGLYFAWSESVRAIVGHLSGGYPRFLIQEFLSGRHGAVVPAIRVDPNGAIEFAALLVLCTAAAVLMRRAVGSSGEDLGPELIVYGSTAVVLPPQLMGFVFWPDGRGHLTNINWLMVTAAGVALLLPIALRRPAPPRTATPRLTIRGWPAAFAAVAVCFAAVCAVHALSTIRGIDSLTYHLPRAASWLRHSRLTTNVEDSIFFFFPGNAELFVRWIVGMSDRLAFLFAFAASALSIYVLYKICRAVNQPHDVAAVAALCAGSCVVLSFVSVGAYVDSFVALHLLLAVLFVIRSLNADNSAWQMIVPAALALGIAVGTKYAALPAAVAISSVWLWRIGRKAASRYAGCFRLIDYRAVGRAALPLVMIAAVPSLFWYARNLVQHGNPVFPAAILGMRGMPLDVMIVTASALDDPLEWIVFPWREAGYLSLEDALGAAFAGAAVLGFVLAPKQFKHRPISTLWWITVASLSLWLVTGNVVLRYGLFAILLMYVFVGELWIAYGSAPLRLITFVAFSVTVILVGALYAVQTVYTSIVGQPHYDVPQEIDRLPPGRIFNATSHAANYRCMGADYRHDLICVYFEARPEHLRRFRPDYVLLRESDLEAFNTVAVLQRVGRSRGRPEISLWRVAALR